MSYFTHNDAKGRDSRIRVQLNRAERAKAAALDFTITLYMSKYELRSRLSEARVYNSGVR
jgi:hypothetical protein